ncbi:type II secretion system protein GspG [Candidatus Babela massiliensis]|uniref:Type II secretory pathway pseudopilin PulG n=1 Tax=Candidatus Babela massiliensis TaxID=673862 RepID=V6DIG9_9BACT|nr:type II secretion system protein GspG [Candidatus Babela massiliensis]CDK30723.1 Type II secretory pathway pseudopilin PulG [Candidatus Babela massiliensis]
MLYAENKRNNLLKEGFSLIEIMIVLLIGAIVVGGAFAGFRYLQNARVQSTKSKLAALDTAIEHYNASIGEYPQTLEELVEGPQKPNLRRKWAGELASQNDLKDAWGKEFHYNLNSKGSNVPYELYAMHPDGKTQIFSPISQG